MKQKFKLAKNLFIILFILVCMLATYLPVLATVVSTLGISNYNTPGNLTSGQVFSIKGTITSNYKITSVTVGVYNSSGSAESYKTVYPSTLSYNVANVDNYITFNTLTTGTKTYKIIATDTQGTKTLVSKTFSITGATSTLGVTGHSVPGNLKVGQAFSVKGTVSSNYTITSLTVGVYNSSGVAETYKTVSPNTLSYNLANVDNYILFDKLTAGSKTYKIIATDSKGSKTLVNSSFTVTSSTTTSMMYPVSGSYVETQSYSSGHAGLDISYNGASLTHITNKITRNIVAVKAGIVVKVLNNCDHKNSSSCAHNSGTGFGGYGNCVLIKHDDGTFSFYAHLMQNSIKVTEKSSISQNTILGMMGNSGAVAGVTGIHLHFEIRKGNYPNTMYSNLPHYNPKNYLGK